MRRSVVDQVSAALRRHLWEWLGDVFRFSAALIASYCRKLAISFSRSFSNTLATFRWSLTVPGFAWLTVLSMWRRCTIMEGPISWRVFSSADDTSHEGLSISSKIPNKNNGRLYLISKSKLLSKSVAHNDLNQWRRSPTAIQSTGGVCHAIWCAVRVIEP